MAVERPLPARPAIAYDGFVRLALVAVLALALTGSMAHADLSGSWRVGFPAAPGVPPDEFCRFDLVQAPDGQIEGWLGICRLGTDGLISGRLDATGALSLRIVAPDDIGCEAYGIDATVAPSGDAIDGAYTCDFPSGLSGVVTLARCDPDTPGSCPETSGLSLPPPARDSRLRARARDDVSRLAGSESKAQSRTRGRRAVRLQVHPAGRARRDGGCPR